MPMMMELAAWNLLVFFLVLVVLQLVSKEIGYRLGMLKKDQPNAKDESIGIVSASIYGLLAFALAFNLSLASTRYGDRRDAVLQEANGIGTLWLQAKAVAHPRAEAIAALTERYVVVRRDAVKADFGSPEVAAASQEISQLQNQMWGHLTALLQESATPQTVQLTGSMNAAFDSTTTTQFAMNRTTPPEVLWLLLGITLLAMLIMGYQFGLNGHPHRALGFTAILVWTSVLFVILDLGSSRIGDIRTDTSVYDSTISSMTAIPIPALTP